MGAGDRTTASLSPAPPGKGVGLETELDRPVEFRKFPNSGACPSAGRMVHLVSRGTGAPVFRPCPMYLSARHFICVHLYS